MALASERILAGFAEIIVAGGTETMSMIPIGGYHFSPNPHLIEHCPDSHLSMGLTAENLALKYRIGREDQDRFALRTQLSFQQRTPSDCITLQRQMVDRALGLDCTPFS